MADTPTTRSGLAKVLGTKEVWALGVGLVISGEYFGWNYGWNAAGTIGFLLATLLVTVLYICFVFSFTELTTTIPEAGGPYAFANAAFGRTGGIVAGYATVIEFVLAPPAIAFALGSYLHFLYPAIPVQLSALGSFVVFTGINLLGIKESARFNLIVTLLAVAELLVFLGVVAPHFSAEHFLTDPLPAGIPGIFAALPFAIWFFLGIEGLAMAAEEVKHPHRNIPRGYLLALGTLVFLALGVMIFAGGVGNWHQLSTIDYPLPETISIALGSTNPLTRLFTSIGLLGLIASFHSLLIGSSRQLFALSRDGLLPSFLSKVNPRHHTPHWALISGSILGMLILLIGKTEQIIILSALGAVVMYTISMLSLFRLRRKTSYHPHFPTPFYPWFPAIALVLSLVCGISIVYYNFLVSLLFFGVLLLLLLISTRKST